MSLVTKYVLSVLHMKPEIIVLMIWLHMSCVAHVECLLIDGFGYSLFLSTVYKIAH